MTKKKQSKGRKAPASKRTERPPVIAVPRPALSSYDPSRPLDKNQLIKSQVHHFHEVDKHLPDEYRTGISPHQIQTEGEASEYIRKVTERLHELGERREKVRQAP